jgi:hypothetical protein
MKIAFITVLAIAGFTSNPVPGWTQPSFQVMAELPQPPDNGTPDGERTNGGRRRPGVPDGACKQTDKPLTALVPENGKGLTTGEHPVFWFYIPYAAEDIHSIEFSLHDRDETTTLYRTSLQLTKTPGVIGIPLPPSPEHSLKLNESYHWYFKVNCESKKPTEEDDIALDGWVTRVQQSPHLNWYDALTNLAKQYSSEAQKAEIKEAWTKLLQSVGLEGLAQEPLVGSVSTPKKD